MNQNRLPKSMLLYNITTTVYTSFPMQGLHPTSPGCINFSQANLRSFHSEVVPHQVQIEVKQVTRKFSPAKTDASHSGALMIRRN